MAMTKSPKTAPDLSSFLTRNEAADLLCVSPMTLHNWERKGLLTRHQGMRGSAHVQILYDPKELARLPHKRPAPIAPGDVESRAFEMFDHHKTVRQVVIDLRITADEAWQIRERWIDAGVQEEAKAPTIEIDPDVHREHSDAELETGINAALDKDDAKHD